TAATALLSIARASCSVPPCCANAAAESVRADTAPIISVRNIGNPPALGCLMSQRPKAASKIQKCYCLPMACRRRWNQRLRPVPLGPSPAIKLLHFSVQRNAPERAGGTVGYWHIAATQHFGRFRSEADIDLQQKLLEENPRRPTGRAGGGEGVGTE